MLLEVTALTLAAIHFGVPLAYYLYMKNRYLNKPWDIKTNPNYQPKITVIVPTYNEAKLIEWKLENIHEQEYPKNKLEVIVVDSASTDGTPELVKAWAEKHPDTNLKLITEPERKGKAHALNKALKHATGEIIITTDADSHWPSKETLKEAVKWLADPRVGAVSCVKTPLNTNPRSVEAVYRQHYNLLRVAESKAFSTPIFHGELAAFKKHLLERVGGFPTDIGADDSHTATEIALTGYRAVTPETVRVKEAIPHKGYLSWRVRRAQHLIQHFAKTLKKIGQAPKEFKGILAVESFLHITNPFLLPASTALLVASVLTAHSPLALTTLMLGMALLGVRRYRTWIAQQLYLLAASLRNLKTKEIAWSKQAK